MNVSLLKEFATDRFTGAAFKEDVIGHNDRGAAMLLQDGEDVLEEVELFVARARPEIVAMHDERLFLFVAGFVDDRDAALLSEWRISQHHLVFAVFTGERVLHHHWYVCRVAPYAVKHEVHATKPRDAIDQ